MKKTALDDCVKLCSEFIHRSKNLEIWQGIPMDYNKKSAALKRTSMELTRRLADLRQGRE